jgi:hypothetical protein
MYFALNSLLPSLIEGITGTCEAAPKLAKEAGRFLVDLFIKANVIVAADTSSLLICQNKSSKTLIY